MFTIFYLETLRKYPPLPLINRECVKDYKVPDENLTIKKGDKVTIHIKAIHHDEEYYPNPSVFDPDRFSPENKNVFQIWRICRLVKGQEFALVRY